MNIIKFFVTCYIDLEEENKENVKDESGRKKYIKNFFITIALIIILFKGEEPLAFIIFNLVYRIYKALI